MVSKINISYESNKKFIDSITLKMNNGSFDLKAKKYIFCIPPKPYYDLVYPLLNYHENLKLKQIAWNSIKYWIVELKFLNSVEAKRLVSLTCYLIFQMV